MAGSTLMPGAFRTAVANNVPAASSPSACSPLRIQAANLLTNGDFEDAKVTPLSGNTFNVYSPYPYPYATNYDELAGWHSPTIYAASYYNTTYGSGESFPPTSSQGGFIPYSGAGAIGLMGSDEAQKTRPSNLNIVSYVTQQIPAPGLSSARKYYASMQVASGSNAQYATPIGLYVTTNNPDNPSNTVYDEYINGVFVRRLWYPKTYTSPATTAPPTGSGIESSGNISSTQWTPVTGIFTGVAGARYVTIGNFKPGPSEQVRYSPTSYLNDAYTYVDKVELYEIPDAGTPPPAVTACGGSALIGRGTDIPGATYNWSVSGSNATFPATLQIQVQPYETTTYTLTVTLPDGEQTVSSVTVAVTVQNAYAGPNKTTCAGQPVVLGGGCDLPGAYYTWFVTGSYTTISNNLHPTVYPTQTTSYTLYVAWPDGSNYYSQTTVYVGAPETPTVTGQGPVPCPDNSEYFTINNFNPDLTYTMKGTGISAIPGSVGFGTNSPTQSTFRMKGGDGKTGGDFTIKASRKCAGTTYTSLPGYYTATFNGCRMVAPGAEAAQAPEGTTKYQFSPNPAHGQVLLEAVGGANRPAAITGVRVYDSYGQLRLEQAGQHAASIQLSVRELPAGLYIVHILDGKQVVARERLQVE